MRLIGVHEEGNNLSNTLRFNLALKALPKGSREEVRASDEYRALIRCFLNFDALYMIASEKNMDPDTKTSVPRIGSHPDFGPVLNVFTMMRFCDAYSKHFKDSKFRFMLTEKAPKNGGAFDSIFQIASLLGVRNVIVNEGQDYVILPVRDILQFGGLPEEIGKEMTEEEMSDALNSGAACVSFNRSGTFDFRYDIVHYRYETGYPLAWDTILALVQTATSCFKWFNLGNRIIANARINMIADDRSVPDGDVAKTDLAEEAGCALIMGRNETMDCVMQLEFYNQLNTIDLTVFDEDPAHYDENGGVFDMHRFDAFMDAIEDVTAEDM
ncbi:MAG: hypothetical protein IJM50_04095 [Lachnospiraceae bacterium]|nr:hypothetical protein [Lachnospiraceae bacterium]